MKKMFFCLMVGMITSTNFLHAEEIREKSHVPGFRYSGFSSVLKNMDIYNPNREDYQAIENFLKRNNTFYKKFRDYQKNAQNVRFYGSGKNETPKKELVVMNTTPDDKECCIVSYSSYNKNYPRGQQRIKRVLKELGYKGHFFYRTGGWPDIDHGGLACAHMIYAFKPAMMKEAQRMGYKKVLWMDTSVVPIVPLEEIFDIIENNGLFAFGGYHPIGPYTSEDACASFGIDYQSTHKLPTFSTGIFGLDLSTSTGRRILDEWYKAAKSEVRWSTARSDQGAGSIILHLLGIDFWVDNRLRGGNLKNMKPGTMFVVDRSYVNQLSGKKT